MIRLSLAFIALATTAQAQSAAEIRLATEMLAEMQLPSFNNDREYCGYLAINDDGELVATPISEGEQSSCQYDGPEDGFLMIASIHTHGRYDADVPAEFPSVGDIEADEDEGVDGFVATPGGRLWYVDTEDMVVRQLCSLNCLPQDPRFRAGDDGVIEMSYTYQELLLLESE